MFQTTDIKHIDKLTIALEPIDSKALMMRAATNVYSFIKERFPMTDVIIAAGPGNNGGDGLAVAKLLSDSGFNVEVWSYTSSTGKRSDDCRYYFDKLRTSRCTIHENEPLPEKIKEGTLVVDALFGTGLSRPLEGTMAEVVRRINMWQTTVVSIDIPSGLGTEESYATLSGEIVKATHTVSFQFPKVAFFLPETALYVGQWHITDIGLHPEAITSTYSQLYYTDASTAHRLIVPRNRCAHKGDMGRAMLFVGSYGMMGAATMAAKACVCCGVGVLTSVIPSIGYDIMQTSVPESMALCTDERRHATWRDELYNKNIKAIGIGPGLGRDNATTAFVGNVLSAYKEYKNVIDADALYHLRQLTNKGFTLPANAVLTPHEGEFDRLTHPHTSRFERLKTASEYAMKHNVVVVLKGAYTATLTPDGRTIFNTTGNPGMATGGMGDLLTGIITALLAQGYDAVTAAVLGVNIHANTADAICRQRGEMGVTPTRMLEIL